VAVAALAVEAGGGTTSLISASAGLAEAWRICNDVRDLTVGDEVIGKPPGDDLRARRMTLPLIYAVDSDPSIGDGLSGKLDTTGAQDLLARVRGSGGLERAAEECRSLVGAWEAGVADSAVGDREPLIALGRTCIDRLPVR
jgi:heptaprenyl diphosphate synthase